MGGLCLVGTVIGAKPFTHSIERWGKMSDLKPIFNQLKESGEYECLYIVNVNKKKFLKGYRKGE